MASSRPAHGLAVSADLRCDLVPADAVRAAAACRRLRPQLHVAVDAVSMQFRAAVCSAAHLGCCRAGVSADSDAVELAVEAAMFPPRLRFPEAALPVPACGADVEDELRDDLCTLCTAVVEVSVAAACPGGDGPLAARCRALGKLVAARKRDLEALFAPRVCSCIGCCPGSCFMEMDTSWLFPVSAPDVGVGQ